MMMNDKEKLLALINQFASGNQQAFAQIIGVPRSNVATWLHRGAITANGREAILDAFPQVSREWLIPTRSDQPRDYDTEMILPGADSDTIFFSRHELTPFFDNCRATCGVAEQFAHPELATEHIHVPGVKALAALTAEGDSMLPTIHPDDICLIGNEVTLSDVSPRRVYLIVTRQGHCMFKRIYDEGQDARKFLVLSDNPDYVPHAEPFCKADLLHVYPLLYVLHKM